MGYHGCVLYVLKKDALNRPCYLLPLLNDMGIFGLILNLAFFGVSIATARLSKNTTINPVTSMMFVKGSNSLIQTKSVDTTVNQSTGIIYVKGVDSPIQVAPVSYYLKDIDVVDMDNDGLSALTGIILLVGAAEFIVRLLKQRRRVHHCWRRCGCG